MASELGGYKFECCLGDLYTREVFFSGCFEPQGVALARALLRPGMSFVDVGANWGLFTLVAAHLVESSGHVVALEPDPRIFARLKCNVGLNHLDHVQIFEAAAANCDSILTLAAHDHDGGNWGTSRLVELDSSQQAILKVHARRLDLLLDEAGLETIDMVKIDVEGAEELVLAGMEAGLSGNRYRAIMLELHPTQLAERGRTIRDVIQVLTAKGYKGYALDYSAAGIRKAFYHPWLHFSEFILPLQQGLDDPLPRTVWLSPDQKDLI